MSVFLLLYFFLQQNNTDTELSNDNVLSTNSQLTSKPLAANDASKINNNLNNNSPVISKHESVVSSILEPEIQQALEKHINTSSEGLEEVNTGKGINVNLQGRFHNVPVATVNEKGKIEISGYNSLPTPGKKND